MVRRRGGNLLRWFTPVAALPLFAAFPLATAWANASSASTSGTVPADSVPGPIAQASPPAKDPALPTAAEDKGEAGAARTRSEPRAPEGRAARGLVDATKVPTAEKKIAVERYLQEQREALARTTVLLQQATSAKDLVQRNCVDERLTQIKGLLRISEEASVKMYEGIAAALEDQINHEFTKISVAQDRSRRLKAEAEQCVGERSVYAGDTVVEVEVDDRLPDRDPTILTPLPPGPDFPAVASSF